jgi:hypothetical protein
VESNWVHSALRPPIEAYCASPGRLWWWRNWWNDWQGKPKYSKKTFPSAALSTTNPTCCPNANPGRHSGKSATNRLSYGTALYKSSRPCVFRFRLLVDILQQVGTSISEEYIASFLMIELVPWRRKQPFLPKHIYPPTRLTWWHNPERQNYLIQFSFLLAMNNTNGTLRGGEFYPVLSKM